MESQHQKTTTTTTTVTTTPRPSTSTVTTPGAIRVEASIFPTLQTTKLITIQIDNTTDKDDSELAAVAAKQISTSKLSTTGNVILTAASSSDSLDVQHFGQEFMHTSESGEPSETKNSINMTSTPIVCIQHPTQHNIDVDEILPFPESVETIAVPAEPVIDKLEVPQSSIHLSSSKTSSKTDTHPGLSLTTLPANIRSLGSIQLNAGITDTIYASTDFHNAWSSNPVTELTPNTRKLSLLIDQSKRKSTTFYVNVRMKCSICKKFMLLSFHYINGGLSYLFDDTADSMVYPYKKNDFLRLAHKMCMGNEQMQVEDLNYNFKITRKNNPPLQWFNSKIGLEGIINTILHLATLILFFSIMLFFLIYYNEYLNFKVTVICSVIITSLFILVFYRMRTLIKKFKQDWYNWSKSNHKIQLTIWKPMIQL